MSRVLALVFALSLPVALLAGPKVEVAAGPGISFVLKDRHGHVTPRRSKCTFSGGGIIDVQQPAPDTVVLIMTGGVVATEHPCHDTTAAMDFGLEQCFDVVFDKPDTRAKLVIEERVIGLLRSGSGGTASESGGCATVTCGGNGLATVCVPDHAVGGCENLSLNDRSGPVSTPVGPGPHTLHAEWHVAASHPQALLGKAASAEFAPEPALDPLWVGGPRDPFHGLGKKDFGLQVMLRLVAEETQENGKK